jgi:hypothetical protein
MPTSRPRYQVTDTGPVREMLDGAERAWPDVRDRKELLLRLAASGARHLAADQARSDAVGLRERQVRAAARSRELVDVDLLLGDAAWR